jgi:integrase
MGVKVREKPLGSGIFWVFINHQGKRKSKKIGTDKKQAHEIAEKIKAKLVLGELNIEKTEAPCPAFKEYAELWLSLPHDWKEATGEQYKHNLNKHVYPVLGSTVSTR